MRSMSEEPILLGAAARNDRDTLAVQFTILLNRNPDYAQVRWLAPDGMERCTHRSPGPASVACDGRPVAEQGGALLLSRCHGAALGAGLRLAARFSTLNTG